MIIKTYLMTFAIYGTKFTKNDCCVFGATRSNKNNDELKHRLCDILDKLYDLNIEIMNDWDNKTYKNKNDYREYILTYGKED